MNREKKKKKEAGECQRNSLDFTRVQKAEKSVCRLGDWATAATGAGPALLGSLIQLPA